MVDGAYGFAGDDLLHGDDTLYVGIDPHAEITRTFTNSEMFFPLVRAPGGLDLMSLLLTACGAPCFSLFTQVGDAYLDTVESGYRAMMAWNGDLIKKVGHRRANYEALTVLWALKAFEIAMNRGASLWQFLLACFSVVPLVRLVA